MITLMILIGMLAVILVALFALGFTVLTIIIDPLIAIAIIVGIIKLIQFIRRR